MEENCIGSQSPQRTVALEKKKIETPYVVNLYSETSTVNCCLNALSPLFTEYQYIRFTFC
jgi:hypothetical protein